METSNERLPASLRATRLRRVEELGRGQGGVVSRTQLYAVGMSRGEVRAQVGARRWRRIGTHCVALHTGQLTLEGRHWVAVLEAGPRAYVDGASALVLAGLSNYRVEQIRVTVPRGARIRHRPSGIDIRQTRRWRREDLAPGGLPRSRPAVAAVRAALWAASDRQATLVLTMAVQQRICRVEEIAAEMLLVRRDKRRSLVHAVLLDLAGGIGSLGELDVIRGCRERGLPEPDVQAVRRTPAGTYFLDFRWRRWGVALEVDGVQHTWAQQVVGDALRHNSIALSGDTVLRLPVLGLRLCPDEFFAQVEQALRANGCPLPDRRTA